jgi:putative transport protein
VWSWIVETLRASPELAIFLALAVGFWIGPKKLGGFSLGNVTATLLAAVAVGQLGITISGPIKSTFFLLFLFAVGYGVGPQFFAGLGRDGPKQIVFSLIVLLVCLLAPWGAALLAGLDVGHAVGLYAGSQTISASIGVATGRLEQLGLTAEQLAAINASIPVAYAVTYIFGTVGSAILLAQVGPWLLRIDLPTACKMYEQKLGGGGSTHDPGVFSAYRSVVVRAYRIDAPELVGKPVSQLFPNLRIFFERVRRGDRVIEADGSTVLERGDVATISGPRKALVEEVERIVPEVEDPELLDMPVEAVDVFVRSKAVNGKTLRELADEPYTRGVYLSKITRNTVEIPILPETEVLRGDILRIGGSTAHVNAAVAALGHADRPTVATDLAVVAIGILIGGLIGSVSVGAIQLSLSSSGGALLAGLVLGYLRTVRPLFNVPEPAVWLMNTLGLNVFIAIVGISAGPGFVAGVQELGLSLFMWGVFATTVPLVFAMLLARYVFRFEPALVLGICAGVRTTTAALGMIEEAAKSRIPALGYGLPYAVGNVFLTMWGMVIVILMTRSAP